jgi:hypothetical protein
MDKAPEPSLRDQLLADYDRHEDAIEAAATTELWALADWLAEYVPNNGRGRPPGNTSQPVITIKDLTERRERSQQWLSDLRKLGTTTRPDRLPQIAPTAYHEALRACKWDLMAANARLLERGHRKRDQRTGPHESKEAIQRELDKRPPEDRADVARELMRDPTVAEIMQGEPVPDFGAAWSNRLVDRVNEQTEKLAELVKREGLIFAPDTDLELMLRWLMDSEARIADVRAAVQERIQDAQMGEVI